MNIYLDPVNIFRLVCLLQGFTTGSFLIFANVNNKVRRCLGLIILVMSFSILDHFLAGSGIYYRHKIIYFMPVFFTWALGPLLYLYVTNLLNLKVKLHWLHFFPVLIQVLFYILIVFQPLATKAWFWQHVHKPYTRYVEYYGMCISVLFYLGLLLMKYKSEILAVTWLKWLLGSISGIFLIALADPVINVWYQPVSMPRFYLITMLLPVSTFWLVMISLLSERFGIKRKPIAYRSYNPDVLNVIRHNIETEGSYRDADLTLQSLSFRLDITANTISRTVNEATGKTFTDYLNELRVEDVKKRIQNNDAEKFTLLSIAYDAGFNSKTTFNRVFKQYTGTSPTAYLSSVRAKFV